MRNTGLSQNISPTMYHSKNNLKSKLNQTEIISHQPYKSQHVDNYIAKKLIQSSLTAHSRSSSISESKTIKSFNSPKQSFQVPTTTLCAIANSAYLAGNDQGMSQIQSLDDFVVKLNKIFLKMSADRPQLQDSYMKLMTAFKKFDLKSEVDKKVGQPISKLLLSAQTNQQILSEPAKSNDDFIKQLEKYNELLKQQPEEKIRILEKQVKESKYKIAQIESELSVKQNECSGLIKTIERDNQEIETLKDKLKKAEIEIAHLTNSSKQIVSQYTEKELSLKHSLVMQ
jgi:hypothetical protein